MQNVESLVLLLLTPFIIFGIFVLLTNKSRKKSPLALIEKRLGAKLTWIMNEDINLKSLIEEWKDQDRIPSGTQYKLSGLHGGRFYLIGINSSPPLSGYNNHIKNLCRENTGLFFQIETTVPYCIHFVSRQSEFDFSNKFKKLGDKAFDEKYVIVNKSPVYLLKSIFSSAEACFKEDYSWVDPIVLNKFKLKWTSDQEFRQCFENVFLGIRSCFPLETSVFLVLSFNSKGLLLWAGRDYVDPEYGINPDKAGTILEDMTKLCERLKVI